MSTRSGNNSHGSTIIQGTTLSFRPKRPRRQLDVRHQPSEERTWITSTSASAPAPAQHQQRPWSDPSQGKSSGTRSNHYPHPITSAPSPSSPAIHQLQRWKFPNHSGRIVFNNNSPRPFPHTPLQASRRRVTLGYKKKKRKKENKK